MASIFDLASNSKGFEKLQQVKDELLQEQEQQEMEYRKHIDEVHRKTHIFESYEQALDWAIKNQNGIEWHTKSLFWEAEKNRFKSYEQEYSYDGVMCYDVVKYYTKEQLLDGIKEHIEYCNKKYPEQANIKWWLDKNGKLEYVYKID